MSDTSREAVERMRTRLRTGIAGLIEQQNADEMLRALLSRAERAEAERDAARVERGKWTAHYIAAAAERDAARAEAERMREAVVDIRRLACAPGFDAAEQRRAIWKRANQAALAAKEPGHE